MASKTTRLLALCIALLFVFVACNGDGSPSSDASGPLSEDTAVPQAGAAEYVTTLCTEMADWLADLQSLQAQVQADVPPGAEPVEAQDALRTFFDNAIAATEDFLTAIEEVGIPGVEGGETIHNDLIDKFEEVRSALEEARSEVDALPIDDRTAFVAEAARLRESVKTQFESIGAALATLSQPDLDAAAAQEPACSGISPTGG